MSVEPRHRKVFLCDDTGNIIGSTIPLEVNSVGKSLAFRQDFDGGNVPVYTGEAAAGTLESEAGWRIKKMSYTDYKLVKIEWAADGEFTQIWNNRGGLSYV